MVNIFIVFIVLVVGRKVVKNTKNAKAKAW